MLQLPVTVEPAALPPGVGAGSVVDVYLRTDGRCPVLLGGRPRRGHRRRPSRRRTSSPATQQVVLAVDQQGVDRWFDLLSRVQQPTVTILARG